MPEQLANRTCTVLVLETRCRGVIEIASAIADSKIGDGFPPSSANFLETRMLAAMRIVRFRPSSTLAG